MKSITSAVELEVTTLTGDEITRMAIGLLRYFSLLGPEELPVGTVFIEVWGNPKKPESPVWVVQTCDTLEEEDELRRLDALLDDADVQNRVLRFEMRKLDE